MMLAIAVLGRCPRPGRHRQSALEHLDDGLLLLVIGQRAEFARLTSLLLLLHRPSKIDGLVLDDLVRGRASRGCWCRQVSHRLLAGVPSNDGCPRPEIGRTRTNEQHPSGRDEQLVGRSGQSLMGWVVAPCLVEAFRRRASRWARSCRCRTVSVRSESLSRSTLACFSTSAAPMT